jgi:hypothetical protein
VIEQATDRNRLRQISNKMRYNPNLFPLVHCLSITSKSNVAVHEEEEVEEDDDNNNNKNNDNSLHKSVRSMMGTTRRPDSNYTGGSYFFDLVNSRIESSMRAIMSAVCHNNPK